VISSTIDDLKIGEILPVDTVENSNNNEIIEKSKQ